MKRNTKQNALNQKDKNKLQLGTYYTSAQRRLVRFLLFELCIKCNENYCFQCGKEIESLEEFSIEHKIPWLDSKNPIDLFFNTDNIAFSHYLCNIRAARKVGGKGIKGTIKIPHGLSGYQNRKCRCEICKNAKKEESKKYYEKKKLKKIVLGN